MIFLSAVLFFLSQHSLLSLPLLALLGVAVGACLARWLGQPAWYAMGVVGLAVGAVNVFTGSMLNAAFLNAYGTRGSAVITHSEQTSSQLNNEYIWQYDAVMQAADGRDVKIHFDTMSASLYPVRNEISLPPVGERFVVKYIPGFERNVAILRDESPYGKRRLVQQARAPVERAAAQLAASPANTEFRAEYRAALQQFLADHEQDAPPHVVQHYRSELQALDQRP
ncbi:hypothetical protein [Bordetella petrii]|uniref:hypothetical protein n=1 Tax=Bordetella petrii TaxID=94624 RepID=UPI001E284350|nr:hypothetical protein [Bordetella petrii]MCD0502875.1 hypothetical protein [Bordetella petrii]